jgi:hypothetical protein
MAKPIPPVFYLSYEDKLDFGKHKGKTLREVLISDYGYILWMRDAGIKKLDRNLIKDALDKKEFDEDKFEECDMFFQPGHYPEDDWFW